MKIEHTVKRKGGSDHSIEGKVYEFREDSEGRHVCDVTNKAHIERFLSIQTFRALGGEESTSGNKPEAKGAGEEPAGGGTGEAPVDDGSDDLAGMNKPELFAMAKDKGLKVDARTSKPDLIAAIEASQE